MLDSDVAGTGELCGGQLVLLIGIIKLLDAAADGPLRAEFRQSPRDFVAVDAIAAQIGTTTLCILDPTPGHNFFHHRGYVTNLVVFFRPTDVEGLVMNQFPGCLQNSDKCTTDIFHMNQGAPRRPIARNQNLSRRVSEPDEIVYDQVGAKPGRNAIRRRIAQVRGTEVVVSQSSDILFHQNFGFPVGRYWIEGRILSEKVRTGRQSI